ncbi:MAG: hypothetical protein ACLTYW_03350 [Collinsella sp.]
MDERAPGVLKTHRYADGARCQGVRYEDVPMSVRAYLDPVLFYAMNCELVCRTRQGA